MSAEGKTIGGNQRSFPIMTVSIGVSTNEKHEISHYGEIIDILIEMKKYAKSLEQKEGSTFVRDKRSSRKYTVSDLHPPNIL